MTFYKDLAEPAMIALARAGNRGVRVDVALRNALVAQEKDREVDLRKELSDFAGKAMNPNSPKQIAGLLYTDLKLPVQKKRPKNPGGIGAVTADNEAIKKLRRFRPEHQKLLTLILDARSVSKTISQLQTQLETRADGESYFVTTYNATGTVTGRVSSSQPIHTDAGGNIQQQKRGPTRRIFTARDGFVLIKCDGSQAEARDVAALMRDEDWLEKFRDPLYDAHTENAMLIYRGTQEQIVQDRHDTPALRKAHRAEWGCAVPDTAGNLRDSLRQLSKPITHGAHYKAGPAAVSKIGDIPYAEAKHGLEVYVRSRGAPLRQWWARVEEMLQTTRCITTVWGRVRYFFGRYNDATIRDAVAHEPQSTVGDIINNAMIHLDCELRSMGGYPLIQAHDEIVCEVPEAAVDDAVPIIRKWFEVPLAHPGISQPLVIPADVSVGLNWYDQKKVR